MAIIERETPERRKLRRLTTDVQPPPPTAFPLSPPDEEGGGGVLDFLKRLPIPGQTTTFGELVEGFDQFSKPFQAITQTSRKGTEAPGFDLLAQQNPVFDIGRRALQFGRKPEEERREFKPTGNLFSDFSQLVELEREEPFLAQLVGGAVTDPTVAFGGGRAAAKVGKEVLEQGPKVARTLAREQTGALNLEAALSNIKARISRTSPATADIVDDLGNDTFRIITPVQREADNLNLSVAKVNKALEVVRGKRLGLTRAQRVERKKRVAKGEAFIAEDKLLEFTDPNEAFLAAKAELRGELAPRVSDELVDLIDEVDLARMANHIRNTDSLPLGQQGFFQRINAYDALRKFTTGDILQLNEIRLLEKLFGPELGKGLRKDRTFLQNAGNVINEAVNLPRAMLTNIWDMSMPLRQGAVLLPNHPIRSQEAAGKMFKSFLSEKVALAVEESIELHPMRDLMKEAGLSITQRRGLLSEREEAVMSTWINSIPVLKQIAKVTFDPASRAAHTFLNKLRTDVFADFAKKQLKRGKTFESHPQDFIAYARFLNWATGRGPIPASVQKLVPFLNGLMFSPRLVSSRFALPIAPAIGPWRGEHAVSKVVRGKMAVELGTAFTTGVIILGLMSRIPGVKVEADPRSSDFGQIQIGGTRFDIWAGFRPIANLFARMLSGPLDKLPFIDLDGNFKSPLTGKVGEKEWQAVMGTFVRSKLAPVPGFGTDVYQGETFLGEPLSESQNLLGRGVQSISPVPGTGALVERLTPLFIMDTLEAFEEDGLLLGAGAGLGAFFGLGTTSFSGLTNTLQEGAQSMFGKDWRDLAPSQKSAVKELPDSQAKMLEIDERSRGVDPQTQATNAFDQLDRIRKEQNDELAQNLRDNHTGKVLRKDLQDAKRELWAGAQALFSPEVEIFLRKDNETAMEELRRLYWTASPLETSEGILDFAHQDKQRNEVLQQAQDLGIDPALVKERSPVFENPAVQNLMDLWNRDIDTLRTFWKGSNDLVRDRLSPARQAVWDDFLSTPSTNRKSQLRKQHPWIPKALSLRNNMREQARRRNPDLDRIFIRWEYSIVPKSEGGAELQQELFPFEP